MYNTNCNKLDLIMIKIGYEHKDISYNLETDSFYSYVNGSIKFHKPNDIIFTQDFMDKYMDYLENNFTKKEREDVQQELLYELDNPTKYLYNTIKDD